MIGLRKSTKLTADQVAGSLGRRAQEATACYFQILKASDGFILEKIHNGGLSCHREDAPDSQVQGHSVSEFGSIGGTRHFKSTLTMI